MRGTLVRPAPVGRLRLSFTRFHARSPRLVQLVVVLTGIGALLPIVLYAWAAAHRIGYGYDFDWLEGGAVELVARVLDGKSLYTHPTLAYVAYPYPPLFAWVSAAVAELTGVGLLPLRIVSLGSSLVAFVALAMLVLRATGDRAAAIVAVGLFAATYGLTGWWFDVGRVDSLFLALTLVALWFGRDAHTVRAGVGLGVLAFLAFFAKQSALVAVGPALALTVLTRWRVGVAAVLTLGLLILATTLLLDATSGGWYRYYVFSELTGQAWIPKEWKAFWRIDLYRHLRPAALLMALALVAWAIRAAGAWRRRAWPGSSLAHAYELAAAIGLLAAAWFSRLHTGGYVNVLMPAYAAVALLGAVAFASLRRRGAVVTTVAAGLVVIQVTGLVHTFSGATPTRAQASTGSAVIRALRGLPGPVLVLGQPWYGTVAGKGSFAQQDAITEVLRSVGGDGSRVLSRDLDGALDRYRIRTVVLDGAAPSWLQPQLSREFALRPAPLTPGALRGGGGTTWPRFVYVRRSPADTRVVAARLGPHRTARTSEPAQPIHLSVALMACRWLDMPVWRL